MGHTCRHGKPSSAFLQHTDGLNSHAMHEGQRLLCNRQEACLKPALQLPDLCRNFVADMYTSDDAGPMHKHRCKKLCQWRCAHCVTAAQTCRMQRIQLAPTTCDELPDCLQLLLVNGQRTEILPLIKHLQVWCKASRLVLHNPAADAASANWRPPRVAQEVELR